MTSIEKAEWIIAQNGDCKGIMCDSSDVNRCPCWREDGDHVCMSAGDDKGKCRKRSVEACEKYLLEHAAEEASKLPLYSDTQQNMQHVLDSMKDLLIYKNNKYGNSALEPMDVFTRHVCDQNTAGLNSILVRLDDKLKRIQNAEELRKNDCSDLIGYLTLLCVEQEWTDFSEFKD